MRLTPSLAWLAWASSIALVTSLVASGARAADALYWTDSGANQIWQSNLDGTDAHVLLPLAAGADPRGIALDSIAGHIYWTENGTNRILRANLDGSNVTSLNIAGLGFPADIELDLAAGKLYWADRDTDQIRRSNLDGSSPETILNLPAAGNNAAPYFISLDLAAGKLYWSDFDGSAIHRANLDGTASENVVTGAGPRA
jgi:hypothetical protein